MINTPERYLGLPVEAAREKVVEDLKKQGKIKKIEKIKHLVATCYRDKSLIEPLPSEQWFVKTPLLQKPLLKQLKKKRFLL